VQHSKQSRVLPCRSRWLGWWRVDSAATLTAQWQCLWTGRAVTLLNVTATSFGTVLSLWTAKLLRTVSFILNRLLRRPHLSASFWGPDSSGSVKVFAAWVRRLGCCPHPRKQMSNWYSYGCNDGISVDCKQYDKLGVLLRNAMELRLISCNCQKENCCSHCLHVSMLEYHTIQYSLVLPFK